MVGMTPTPHERDADLDRPMDSDEERDFADQGPLTDMGMKEDSQISATLLRHIPCCMSAADIEQLLQNILVQPPVVLVVPVRTVQGALASGDLPLLDVDVLAANFFSQSERILQERVK
jgi:hypothetical protein